MDRSLISMHTNHENNLRIIIDKPDLTSSSQTRFSSPSVCPFRSKLIGTIAWRGGERKEEDDIDCTVEYIPSSTHYSQQYQSAVFARYCIAAINVEAQVPQFM